MCLISLPVSLCIYLSLFTTACPSALGDMSPWVRYLSVVLCVLHVSLPLCLSLLQAVCLSVSVWVTVSLYSSKISLCLSIPLRGAPLT